MKKFFACAIAFSTLVLTVPHASANGSIAINKDNRTHFGISYNQRGERHADEVANDNCTGNCSIVFRFERTCAALATEGSAHGAYGFAHDDDLENAKHKAKRECESSGGSDCRVITYGCDK